MLPVAVIYGDHDQAEHKPCILEKLQSRAFCWTRKKKLRQIQAFEKPSLRRGGRKAPHAFHM